MGETQSRAVCSIRSVFKPCRFSLLRGVLVVLVALGSAGLARAHGGHIHEHRAVGAPTAEETAAFAAAKPALEKFCFPCHTSAGRKAKAKAMKHLSMDSYPFAGHHADEAGKAVQEVLGVSGKNPSMPPNNPGAVKGDDLRAIVSWADAFERARSATPSVPPQQKAADKDRKPAR